MKQSEPVGGIQSQHICTFRPEAKGGYTVRCAAFPELITNGRTLEAARSAAREALELCLEVYRDEGWPIPEPDADPRQVIKEVVPATLAPV